MAKVPQVKKKELAVCRLLFFYWVIGLTVFRLLITVYPSDEPQ